ncbi:MAG: CheR family methyltransferase [Nitrospiria bacterium]
MITKEIKDFFFSCLHRESGLVLDDSKIYLLESRLEPLVAQEGFPSLEEFGRWLIKVPSSSLIQKVIEAMTTNETSFFRDRIPFDILKNQIIPNLIKMNQKSHKIRIWSACCSTGQEPYSISMLLSEFGPQIQQWDISILATDIDQKVLHHAQLGVYSQYEVQRGLPILFLTRYFNKSDSSWIIRPEIRKRIEFKLFNLMTDFSSFGVFDVIFCRNVLIYFDVKTKKKILELMARMLTPSGVLFLGSTETSIGLTEKIARVQAEKGFYYRKVQ